MSYRHLTLEEGYQIQTLRCRATQAEIARILGRSPSTISRELSRNAGTVLLPYSAKQAAFKARARRIEKGKAERKIQGELESLVDQKLRLGSCRTRRDSTDVWFGQPLVPGWTRRVKALLGLVLLCQCLYLESATAPGPSVWCTGDRMPGQVHVAAPDTNAAFRCAYTPD